MAGRFGKKLMPAGLAVLFLLISGAGALDRLDDAYSMKRKRMVTGQLRSRGIRDKRVLEAMAGIPRHEFVPEHLRSQAYEDYPLPIGEGQTISQPYIVALMTQHLELEADDKVLEIGTGSGYQAAVLARIAARVFSIEINPRLADSAARTLKDLGIDNVSVKCGDGFFGYPDEAPFDAIIVTCAVGMIPSPLFEQLSEGGRLILPLGEPAYFQTLTLIVKEHGKQVVKRSIDVRFVPMTGEAEKRKIAFHPAMW